MLSVISAFGRETLPAPVMESGPAEVDFVETDADDASVPALARRFRITDPQHWIDLCA